MGTIRSVTEKVVNFEQYQEKIMLDCIIDSEETILDANREQMMEGKDKQGNYITPEYTPFTIEIKEQKGQRTDVVTLRDTGDFHKQLFMKVDKNIVIDSSDEKTEELMIKYDRERDVILGIPETDKTSINETIMSKWIRIFREMTNL